MRVSLNGPLWDTPRRYAAAVSELAAIATVLLAVSEAAESLGDPHKHIEVFTGLPQTGGAGVAAHVTVR
jgi:hypothetical protein